MTYTDIAYGGAVDSADLNANFNHIIMKKDVMAIDTTEYSTSATTPTVVKTYTFTPDNDGFIPLIMKVSCDSKLVGGGAVDSNVIRITGMTNQRYDSDATGGYFTFVNADSSYSSDSLTVALPFSTVDVESASTPLVRPILSSDVGPSSWDIDITMWVQDLAGGAETGTAYITNIVIELWYFDGVLEETDSARFS